MIPILLYHSVAETASPRYRRWTVRPSDFADQIRVLLELGFTPMTMSDLVDARRSGTLPPRPCAITFDDGRADFVEHALPVLVEHGVPATIYVVTGAVGRTSSWLPMAEERDQPMLTWDELADVAASGVEVGGHSRTHCELDVVDRATLDSEIAGCREDLLAHLGAPIRSFAYPHGYHSRRVVQAVKAAGFDSAVAVHDRWSWWEEPAYAWARRFVWDTTTTNDLRAWLAEVPTREARSRAGLRFGWRQVRRARLRLRQVPPPLGVRAAAGLAAVLAVGAFIQIAPGSGAGTDDVATAESAPSADSPPATIEHDEHTDDTAGAHLEPATEMPPAGYSTILAEEFDGDALDDRWTTCYWWQVDGGCTIISNDEQQWYQADNVRVADGVLTLTARADPQTTTDGRLLPYSSGVVTTGHVDNDVPEPGFAFTYGYVEARIKLPDADVDGTWPAVWLLSADRTSLPEIDIFEWYGSRPGISTSHVHHRVDGERNSGRVETEIAPTSDGWHTVAALWDDDQVVFWLDGVETGRVVDPQLVPHQPMYVILNLAIGGVAGEVDAEAMPQEFQVDYIRVWQQEGER